MAEVTPISRAFSVTQTMDLAMGSMVRIVPLVGSALGRRQDDLAVHKLVTVVITPPFTGQSVTASPGNLYGSSQYLLRRRGVFACSCVSYF